MKSFGVVCFEHIKGVGSSYSEEGSLKEGCCLMKRLLLAVVVVAMMLMGSALPALATHETGDPEGSPDNPRCDWYPFSNEEEEWWEYWCRWPHWGWEFVFWTY